MIYDLLRQDQGICNEPYRPIDHDYFDIDGFSTHLVADKRRLMNNRISNWAIIASKILFWIIGILAIYWLILKLTNHSPTVIDLILSLQIATITILVGFMYKTAKHMGKVENYMRGSDKKFNALANDFKKHVRDMHPVKTDVEIIKSAVKRLMKCKNYKPA